MSDRSIYFPERFETADEHLAWWQSVPVPDALLQQVTEEFPDSRRQMINVLMGGLFQGIQKDPSWSDAEYRARHAEAARAYNDKLAHVKESMPEEIDRFLVRDAVRLHLAWTYRYTLPEAEQEKLAAETIQLGELSGTLPAFDRYFAMGGFAARHPEAFTRLPDDNATLRAELETLRRMVAQQSETVTAAERHSANLLGRELAGEGHTREQVEAALRGEAIGRPVSVRQARKSWKD